MNFPLTDNDAHRAGPVWIPGPPLAGFIKRTTIHFYIQNMKTLFGHTLKKKDILNILKTLFSSCLSNI